MRHLANSRQEDFYPPLVVEDVKRLLAQSVPAIDMPLAMLLACSTMYAFNPRPYLSAAFLHSYVWKLGQDSCLICVCGPSPGTTRSPLAHLIQHCYCSLTLMDICPLLDCWYNHIHSFSWERFNRVGLVNHAYVISNLACPEDLH